MKPVLSGNNNSSSYEETEEDQMLLPDMVFCLKAIDELQLTNRLQPYSN